MSRRLEILPLWVEAVRTMEPERALEFVAPDFVFLDGALSEPVTRDGFADYLLGWESRMRAIGGTGRYEVIDEVVQDGDSVLLTPAPYLGSRSRRSSAVHAAQESLGRDLAFRGG